MAAGEDSLAYTAFFARTKTLTVQSTLSGGYKKFIDYIFSDRHHKPSGSGGRVVSASNTTGRNSGYPEMRKNRNQLSYVVCNGRKQARVMVPNGHIHYIYRYCRVRYAVLVGRVY